MTRAIDSALAAEIVAAQFRPIMLFEGDFGAGGVLRLWTGLGTIVWDSQTWYGAGTLLGVSGVDETVDLRAATLTVTLSGMPPEIIAAALTYAKHGADGKLYFGAFDETTQAAIAPYLVFSGRLDVPAIQTSGDNVTVSVAYESRMIALEIPKTRRYTDQDQKITYPEDRGFEYVAALQDAAIPWGVGGPAFGWA